MNRGQAMVFLNSVKLMEQDMEFIKDTSAKEKYAEVLKELASMRKLLEECINYKRV